ncbi:hypothetical protein OS493_007017 [Desmophyllum pertusum]|uniref:Uncharacterized protein n=1 Tax=Desmophyllum pertusum TaxID=174260 RepID=A0A9X0CYJ3_9CNID|nr:hypothetical protein OS493_007017 [Desmophyllum pertusum]
MTWEKIDNELKERTPRFHQFITASVSNPSHARNRGGLKKVGLQRLSSLYNCMGYKATNTMFEKFGNDFDRDLKVWKEAVEKAELQSHRRAMHPGYYFTGDNVDIRCKPDK